MIRYIVADIPINMDVFSMKKYSDRKEAGKILAEELSAYTNRSDVLVLALPRGGVPVGFEIATRLNVPLDVFIVRKLGVPGHKELAMGAIAVGGVRVFNNEIIRELNIPKEEIEATIIEEVKELQRRNKLYRDDRPLHTFADKTIILVDDGIATGATMRAAIAALRKLNAKEIVVAVPVAEAKTCEHFAKLADHLICPLRPMNFMAVGAWYDDFAQTTDDEVYALLKESTASPL